MATEIPVIETDRLRLRAWKMEDFEPLATFLADPELSLYRTAPVDRFGAWKSMCAHIGQWQISGYGVFGAALKETDEPVGYTGLYHPIILDEPELAWSLFRRYHGNGYAVEMARAARDWAARDLGLGPLASIVHPDNAPSIRVAERLGATLEGTTTYLGEPRLLYRHAMPTPENSPSI